MPSASLCSLEVAEGKSDTHGFLFIFFPPSFLAHAIFVVFGLMYAVIYSELKSGDATFYAKCVRPFLSLYNNRLNNDGISSVIIAAWHFFFFWL